MADLTKRQREIIESSAQIIEEKGIQNLTIKRLAASMKISEPAIYRHFDSKQEILITILDDFNGKIRNSLILKTADITDPLEQIKSVFKNHIRILTNNPTIASIIFSEEIFQNDKRLSEMVFSIMKMRKDVIIDIIKKAQNENKVRTDISADDFSLIFFGALRLLVKEWRLSNHSFNLKERGSALLESLLKVIV
jgi:AcrR family transcriptional regulator